MESYSNVLKKAREEKMLDLDTVARETSITKEYIIALEEENASAFPGEPYMIGFLRNYAEYLGIDPESVFALYKNKVIQEAPVPEGLLVKHKPRYFFPVLIGSCALALILFVLGVVFIVNHVKAKKIEKENLASSNVEKKYELTSEPFEGRLFLGDQILIPNQNGKLILTVAETLSRLKLKTPVGDIFVELAEEASLDVDGDAQNDLIVFVSDISSTNDARGVDVRMLLSKEDVELLAMDDAILTETENLPHEQKVIINDTRAYPFTVNVDFRANCEFRYRVDRGTSEESYYSNGDRITMTANNAIRLWMSNAATVKFTVIAATQSFDLDIGQQGHVLVQDIKWIRDSEGRYRLVVVELD